MYKLILLNVVCLFCVLTIGLADQSKPDLIDANKTASSSDKKPIVLDAKAVMKTPSARDLKQSESHVGILYPHHPHYHHGHHGYHGYHHGYHHYPYHHLLHHKYHHMHHLHYPYYHHLHHLHHPYYHHHHYHGYPHYPYYGYLHFSNIYGLNFSPLFNQPLYHLKPHLHHPTHLPHHFFPKPHYYPPHHYPLHHYSPHYPHHNPHPCRCECSKYAMMNAKLPHGNPHHLSKMKPMHDLSIHSLNGHPINGHPLNRPHHLNGHAINGHAINGHATTGHSMPFERPHFKLNAHDSYKSRDKPHNDALGEKPDKTIDKPLHGDFPKLPPNELMSQLVDFDTGYMLPKHGHPAMQSVMQDRYRRLIYGQFLDGNLMSPSNYLYEPFSPDHLSTKPNGRPPAKGGRTPASQAGKTPRKKTMKKELEHLQLQNGGQMHLIKMGMIK